MVRVLCWSLALCLTVLLAVGCGGEPNGHGGSTRKDSSRDSTAIKDGGTINPSIKDPTKDREVKPVGMAGGGGTKK